MTRTYRPAALARIALAILVAPASSLADDPPTRKGVLVEALAEARTIENPRSRDGVLHTIIGGLASSGLADEAQQAAGEIRNEDWRRGALMQVAEGRARAGDMAAALRVLGQFAGPQAGYHRSEGLRRVAVVQARRGDHADALGTVRLDPNPAARRIANLEVIAIHAEGGDVAGAVAAAMRLEDAPIPDLRLEALARVATVQANRGDVEGACRTLEKFAGGSAPGDVAIAEIRRRAGDLPAAVAAARRALAASGHLATEAAARLALVRGLTGLGDLDAAREAARGPWKEPQSQLGSAGLPPSIDRERNEALRCLAHAQAGRGDLDGALRTLSGIRPPSEQVVALAALAIDRAEAGDRDSAIARILPAALKFAEEGRVDFYLKDVAAAQFQCGQTDASRENFDRALLAKNLGSPLNRRMVALTQARSGDLEGALLSAARIPEAEIRAQAVAWIAIDLARLGRADVALDVAAGVEPLAIRCTTLAHVAKALADSGDSERSASVARRAGSTMETPPAEAARLIAHAWAATPPGAAEAVPWARRQPTAEARASALLGAADGIGGREMWVRPSSPFLDPARP